MKKIQSLGVHHITLTGADRQTSIDFWEGVLGMPFIFDQPNLDNDDEGHLYFDPGDGRLITIFSNENRKPVHDRTPTDPGCVHHIAFEVDHAMFDQVLDRLSTNPTYPQSIPVSPKLPASPASSLSKPATTWKTTAGFLTWSREMTSTLDSSAISTSIAMTSKNNFAN